MRKIPYKTWLWAGIFLLYPWVAHAAGLGKFTVLSALGQPLAAEIDLVSIQKDELSSLTARIASPDAFQQANIQYSPALIGVRLSIERRSDGKPYIKVISTRPVNEPFLSVLVELSWAQGRLVREYTALVDPPGYTAPVTPPVASAPVVVAPVAPETKPIAPTPQPDNVATEAAPKPAQRPAAVAVPRPAASGTDYAVKRGDTLAKIAASVKPEGVTLDQVLVSLYRNNSDAFAGNMNRLKTGKILRVPEKERIAETATAEATKEVRVQASDWNSYRQKVADAAGTAPAAETPKSATSGKITPKVDDKATGKEAPKEVLKLSKGETPVAGPAGNGKPVSAKDRVRMLEEEATAREKSLAEANGRVAQLEKNIKDMQRLLEMKGIAPPAGKPAVPPPPAKAEPAKSEPVKAEPAKKTEPAKADPAKVEPAKAEPAKAEPAKAEPPKDAGKAPVEAAKGDQKGTPAAVVEPAKGDATKAGDAAKAEPAPKPKPKPTAPPPPPPEPSLVDQLTDPLVLAAGIGGLVVLGGGAFWFARRRRAQDDDTPGAASKSAPTLAKAAPATASTMAASPMASPVAGNDDVDPLAEADLYLNFGRDAQAEEVLKEALEKNPQHEEAQLKLLQIYAARKDKAEFEKIAKNLHTQTAGIGDNWLKAAGMGYAFDAENPLYEAGKAAPAAAVVPVAGGAAVGGTDLDFDLELSAGSDPTATDVPLDSGEKTMIMRPGELAAMSGEVSDTSATQDITQDSVAAQAFTADVASPDFTLNAPAGAATTNVPDFTVDAPPDESTRTNVTGDSAASPMVSAIDFNFDAPKAPEPPHDSTVIISPENQDKAADLAMDFDIGSSAPKAAAPSATSSVVPLDPAFMLDLGGDAPAAATDAGKAAPAIPDIRLDDLNLTLDDAPKADAAAASGGAKDDHWYDVQTKFDLAKAYQEMGDKDGAREILHEVIKEGDAAQQAEANQLLAALG